MGVGGKREQGGKGAGVVPGGDCILDEMANGGILAERGNTTIAQEGMATRG
jgi:hypothetical protein